MLIKALCDYYDVLAEQSKVLPDGYSTVPIKYLVALTPDGKIEEIVSCQGKESVPQKSGKVKEKLVPKMMILPERTEKPGIESNFIEHRPLYIFGLNYDNGILTPEDRTDKAKKSHAAFTECNLNFIEDLDSPLINAFRSFLQNWKADDETQNLNLLGLGKEYANSGFVFCLSGESDKLLQDDPLIRERWERVFAKAQQKAGEYQAQCAVTGEISDIARLHNKIKGIAGGASTGGVLIGYNNPSECSYGNEQSYNSNISEIAMRKYTEALNYILHNDSHKMVLDEVTVAFWAMDGQEKCENFMQWSLADKVPTNKAAEVENYLRALLKRAPEADMTMEEIRAICSDIDPDVDFYMVGFKPNSSRISVKFIYRRKVGEILWNIAKFQQDLQLSESVEVIPLYRIKKEFVSPNSDSDKANPELITQLFKSVVYGTSIPYIVLETIIRRVKTDKYVNSVRAGVIKAYLNRSEKEKIKMALDKENYNQAYLCGRLFAVLENMQKLASKTALNRTIKDKYFASSAGKPATVFPKLIQLSHHHMKNLSDGSKVYYSKLIGEIMSGFENEFPATLSMREQGKFAIGYYQQTEAFYAKKADEEQ